jgi:hypothetical protein
MKSLIRFLPAGLATLGLLAACGGGNDAPPTPPSLEVPPSASASSAGMVSYMTLLNVTAAEEREPVDVIAFNPQQPDDTEPQALN